VQKVEGRRRKKIQKKGAGQPCPCVDPRPAGDRWSPAGPGLPTSDQQSPTGRRSTPGQDHIVPFFFYNFFGRLGEWAKALGRMGAQYTHFFKLPPTLGSVKSSISHRVWRFYFFCNFIFPKFRVHLDLHIYRSDFCFMEN
jgi:hypothetical protein